MIYYVSIFFNSLYYSLFADNTYDLNCVNNNTFSVQNDLLDPVIKITNNKKCSNEDPFISELKCKIKRFYTNDCINDSKPTI